MKIIWLTVSASRLEKNWFAWNKNDCVDHNGRLHRDESIGPAIICLYPQDEHVEFWEYGNYLHE